MSPNWAEIWQKKGKEKQPDSPEGFDLNLSDLIELNGFHGIHGTHTNETFQIQVEALMSRFKHLAKNETGIFEIGCGAGAFLKAIEEKYDLNTGGSDLSKALLDHAKNSLEATLGLFHSEAIQDIGIRNLDLIFSHSVFHYFPSEEYAFRVLNLMTSYLAENRTAGLAVLDVRDKGKADEYFLFRTESLEPKDWTEVGHKLFSKEFFADSLSTLGFDAIEIVDLEISHYGNSPYSFNVFATRP